MDTRSNCDSKHCEDACKAGIFGRCWNTSYLNVAPEKLQELGGSNSFFNPKVNAKVYFRNAIIPGVFGLLSFCEVGGTTVLLDGGESKTISYGPIGFDVNVQSYMILDGGSQEDGIVSKSIMCCDSGESPGAKNSYSIYDLGGDSKSYQGCTIPNYDDTFGEDGSKCSDCGCGDAKNLAGAYGCNQAKIFSLLCKNQVALPAICVASKVDAAGFQQIKSGCYPAPLAPPPPQMCKCSLPTTPAPAYAYPVCTAFNPPAILADADSSASGQTSNNCVPQYRSPNTAALGPESTYYKPVARVFLSNPIQVGTWESPVNGSGAQYCGANSKADKYPIKKACDGNKCTNQNESDCFFISSGQTNITSTYVNDQGTVEPSVPTMYVFSSGSDEAPSPSGPENTAFVDAPVGNTSMDRFGFNNAQFGDVSFDFSALGDGSKEDCTLNGIYNSSYNPGNSSKINNLQCPGSKSITLQSLDKDSNDKPYERTFISFLPDECGPKDDPYNCTQYCVAEYFAPGKGLPYSISCFPRPQPTKFSVERCKSNSSSNKDCDSYINDYNSLSKWCLDMQIEDQPTMRVCGDNRLNKMKFPDDNPTQVVPLLTDINFNQPPSSLPSGSKGYCPAASDPTSFNSCPIGFYNYTDSKKKNEYIQGGTMLCGISWPNLSSCPMGCTQFPNCTSEKDQSGCDVSDLAKMGCNCISAQQNYCSDTGKYDGNCSSPDVSLRPSDRSTPDASDPTKYNPDILAQLAPWLFNKPTDSPPDGSGLRGRTPMENGLCTIMTQWDPVDCCAMYGSDSDIAKDANANPPKLQMPDGISVEDFYNACQAFTCKFTTVTEDSLKEDVSGAIFNDAAYMSKISNDIYEACVQNQAPTLPDPSFFSSNDKLSKYVQDALEPIKKITDIYGTGVLCSFFQPGSSSSDNGGPARCNTSTVTVASSDGFTNATCGALAPANYDSVKKQMAAATSVYAYCQDQPKSLSGTKGLFPSQAISKSSCKSSYGSCKKQNCPKF
ncbi:MAG: hypothetical protein RLN62_05705 [Rickettsiales bacterium]